MWHASSMASANLDLVRSMYAAFERGDYRSADWADPEIEFVIVDGPSPGRWVGFVGIAKGFGGWLSAWEDFRVEVDEYRELDDERILVLIHRSGRGRTSGLEIDQMRSKGAQVYEIRGGKVTRIVSYFDCDRGFADLGLAPEAG